MKQQKSLPMPIALDVDLRRGWEAIGRYKTRAIGFNSIHLEDAPAGLELHDSVDIILHLANRRFRMKGIFAFHSSDTTTLMFTRYVTAYSELLGKLLEWRAAEAKASDPRLQDSAAPTQPSAPIRLKAGRR